jgi:hypothetical protein
VAAVSAIRGEAGRWSADVLGAFSKGIAKEKTSSWWEVLRPSLRFFGPQPGVLTAGVHQLSLPA